MEKRVLKGLEPAAVFQYFEEICGIPHGSGNIQQISDYLVEFAKKNGLAYVQEPCGNVIMHAPATPGYENRPGVILQGHMDMVAVKDADCTKDMEKEGLDLFIEMPAASEESDDAVKAGAASGANHEFNGLVGARGTTLGGDDDSASGD